MPSRIPEDEVSVCSKCRREIKIPKEKISGEGNILLCDACYRNGIYPELKSFDCELFDAPSGPDKNTG